MSIYEAIPDDEIDIDFDDAEVTIYTGYDYSGSIYAVLSFDQILAIADKIRSREP